MDGRPVDGKAASQSDPVTGPMSIYEVHLGSWRKKNRPEKDGFYTYVEAAHELTAYVRRWATPMWS